MLQNLRKRNEGFTIIEVLIVLAIAGLIMLVVFLAVPALQRNSRNTQAKSAANAVLATVNEFENNNNGVMPTTLAISNGVITVSSTVTGTTNATGKTQGGYTGSVVTAFPTSTSTGVFSLGIDQKCNGNTAFTAAPRSAAVAFFVETGGATPVAQCIEG